MRGDFSAWNKERSHNFRGTLHQQGRVLLDRDWNAQTEIMVEWQETAARDAFGAGVAAVPADAPQSFKVISAEITGGEVKITLKKGRVWADGLLAELFKDANSPMLKMGLDAVVRTATYLGPPIQSSPGPGAIPSVGDVDAVILETWLEELSPFQDTDLLIEPALGGVDTTERVQTAFRFRLYRNAVGDTCDSIISKLKDDSRAKGKLTAELISTVTIDGDCPVVESGGFTGFEHRLYRIEIADTDRADPESYFKWSHFNGGLVGTGDFDAVMRKVTIYGNKNAIVYSGSNNFFLEALDYDTALGCWKVVYGAKATLSADGTISLPDPVVSPGDIFKGEIPPVPTNGKRFFRLWNGIERVADFTAKKDLPDNLGILLQFEPEGIGKYTPSDFWTFEMRAGGIGNPLVLIPNLPPQGILYHRVPLSQLHWTGNTITDEDIKDCRHPFQPLTKIDSCCTYTVGDGQHSQGDYSSIEQAISALPSSGGLVCLLPGIHQANALIEGKQNIIIRGCGKYSKVLPLLQDSESPIFTVKDSVSIVLEHMDLATPEGTAILIEGSQLGDLSDVTVRHNHILAYEQAINVSNGTRVRIHNNAIRQLDKEFANVAIYMMAEDSVIERNEVLVIPADKTPSLDDPDGGPGINLNDPCADFEVLYLFPIITAKFWYHVWNVKLDTLAISSYNALGGIQIAGSSERIKIRDNKIQGGSGNGITLGSFITDYEFPSTPPGGDEPEFLVKSINDQIVGYVYDADGSGLEGVELSFIDEIGNAFPEVTGSGGGFAEEAPDGTYQIIVTTPGFRIDNIESMKLTAFKLYMVTLVEVEEEPVDDDMFGFIYDVDIHDNEIFDMGLSGIGGPQLKNILSHLGDNTQLSSYQPGKYAVTRSYRNASGLTWVIGALLSSLVVGLRIQRNHIHHCVNTTFDRRMRSQAGALGYGGIVLMFCESVQIEHNRIEENGASHIDPICGILANGSNFNISDNHILNNGPLQLELVETQMDIGIRGGIIVNVFSVPLTSLISTLTGEQSPVEMLLFHDSLPAASIHDNTVYQPTGPALFTLAMGSLTVLNNRFSTELAGPFIGSLTLGNFGPVNIVNYDLPNLLGQTYLAQSSDIRSNTSSGLRINTNLGASTTSERAGTSLFGGGYRVHQLLTGGAVLFNNNHTRLGMARNCFASQVIMSTGDIGFDGNHSVVNAYDDLFVVNTVLMSSTIRANDSRFIERQLVTDKPLAGEDPGLLKARKTMMVNYEIGVNAGMIANPGFEIIIDSMFPLSLATRGNLMNNTSDNQGNHCIIATPLPVAESDLPTVFAGNQMPFQEQCGQLGAIFGNWGLTQQVSDLLR